MAALDSRPGTSHVTHVLAIDLFQLSPKTHLKQDVYAHNKLIWGGTLNKSWP